MVVGNGLIASQFYNYHLNKDVLIFASGVSNSSNKLQSEFDREVELLQESFKKHPEKINMEIL